MKAAVLLNPFSGDTGRFESLADSVRTFLRDCETVGVRGFGGEGLKPDTLLSLEEAPYLTKLKDAVRRLASASPDIFVVAGGDGFASYIADVLCFEMPGMLSKIVGIAAGTANVGPIISLRADDLPHLTPDDLVFEPWGAVEAFTGGRHLAFGFNDVVLGNTILGTVDGQARTISASAMYLEGKKVETAPLCDLGPFVVAKNGRAIGGCPHTVSQIILSTLEREHLYGRAVTGLLCYSEGTSDRAAVVLSRRPLVTMDHLSEGYDSFSAVSQLLFGCDDEIRISGLPKNVSLAADGNPFPLTDGEAVFRCRTSLVLAARPKEVEAP